jgi:RNA polymerase sigma-70 factor (family 1)
MLRIIRVPAGSHPGSRKCNRRDPNRTFVPRTMQPSATVALALSAATAPEARTYPKPGPRPMQPDDPYVAWCRGIQASDERAFKALFQATHPALVRYATGFTGDEAAAADIAQDAFLKVWERRHELDPNRSVKALLYRIARNLALNHGRDRRGRDEKHQLIRLEGGSGEPLPDEFVVGRDLRARLDAWIGQLPERQREALTLSRFEGLSHDEIAEVMSVSPRTVNNHLVKALAFLRERTRAYEPGLLASQ